MKLKHIGDMKIVFCFFLLRYSRILTHTHKKNKITKGEKKRGAALRITHRAHIVMSYLKKSNICRGKMLRVIDKKNLKKRTRKKKKRGEFPVFYIRHTIDELTKKKHGNTRARAQSNTPDWKIMNFFFFFFSQTHYYVLYTRNA